MFKDISKHGKFITLMVLLISVLFYDKQPYFLNLRIVHLSWAKALVNAYDYDIYLNTILLASSWCLSALYCYTGHWKIFVLFSYLDLSAQCRPSCCYNSMLLSCHIRPKNNNVILWTATSLLYLVKGHKNLPGTLLLNICVVHSLNTCSRYPALSRPLMTGGYIMYVLHS